MADLSKLVLNGSEYNLKDSVAREGINEIDKKVLKKLPKNSLNNDIRADFEPEVQHYFYISPTGSDTEKDKVEEGNSNYGDGTSEHPFFSINKVLDYCQNNFIPRFTGDPNHRDHAIVIVCYPGVYRYTETQVISTLYMHSYYSGSVKIQALHYSTINENYANYTPEQIDALNPESEGTFPIFDFSEVDKSLTCFEILTSCFMFGVCIKGNSRALTCYDEVYSTNKINGEDQHARYISEHGLSPYYYTTCITERCNGIIDIRDSILMDAYIGLNLYKNNFNNYIQNNFLKIQNCEFCLNLCGIYPIDINCKNLVFDTFRFGFNASDKMNHGAVLLKCINLLAKNWNHGVFITRSASVELSIPDEYTGLYSDNNTVSSYNRFTRNIEPKRFIKIIPSASHIADATDSINSTETSVGDAKRSVICATIPVIVEVTTVNPSAGNNFVINLGWQIKFGEVDITDYLKYQPHIALYKNIQMLSLSPTIRNAVNIPNLPCNILLYDQNCVRDFSCWSFADYTEITSNGVVVAYKRRFANMSSTRLYQYGRVTIDKTKISTSLSSVVNYMRDFSSANPYRNGCAICSNIEEIMLIVTPDSNTDTVTITNKATTGFSFEATGSFNWMAVNVNELLHGILPN